MVILVLEPKNQYPWYLGMLIKFWDTSNGSAHLGTTLYLIMSQRPLWQRSAESETKVTIYYLVHKFF